MGMHGSGVADDKCIFICTEQSACGPAGFIEKIDPEHAPRSGAYLDISGRLGTDHYWIPTTAVLGGTAGLMALDPTEGSYFRNTSTFHHFNNVFTGNATLAGILAAPVSFYVVGLFHQDSKMKNTALLAAEALGDSELVTTVIKDTTRRIRPIALPTNANFSDSWFESPGSLLRGRGSFPSGHTIAAMSIATVIARRYGRQHRWVPYVAYGLTALVGFSRMTLSAHFASDVFMGAAMGYAISRFEVLRQ
jgi:membrane-associated phospholipid phosphatase